MSVTARLTVAGSPAAAAGVRVGDELLAIDGRPVSEIPATVHGEDLFSRDPGTPIELRLRREGETRNVVLESKRLI